MDPKEGTLFIKESCLKETNVLEVCGKLRLTLRVHLVDRVVEGRSRGDAKKR